MLLASLAAWMRMLEARFHPRRRGQSGFETVGFLVWKSELRGERPGFEPARATIPDAVISKLHYLVAITEPDSFERLQLLRSEFWSFIALNADDREGGTAILGAEVGEYPHRR